MLEVNYDPKKHPVPGMRNALNLYKSCLDQGEIRKKIIYCVVFLI